MHLFNCIRHLKKAYILLFGYFFVAIFWMVNHKFHRLTLYETVPHLIHSKYRNYIHVIAFHVEQNKRAEALISTSLLCMYIYICTVGQKKKKSLLFI